MVISCGPESIRQYAPPVAGNGDLSLMADFQGAQFQHAYHKIYPAIWWAGRRYDTACRELVPFGHFEQEIRQSGELLPAPPDWKQSLDTREAVIRSTCHYNSGVTIDSEIMVHANSNLIMVRKQFLNDSDLEFQFRYSLAQPGPDGAAPRRMRFTSAIDPADGSATITYQIDGQWQYHGLIALFADRPLEADCQANRLTLTARIPAGRNGGRTGAGGECITYFLFFQDNLDDRDYQAEYRAIKQRIRQGGPGALLDEHRDAWRDYWAESAVQVPDPPLMRSYEASLYHLRCATTRWSIPIAIADTHWHCRYFGFDEFFGYMGLLTSNHLGLARRVPEFRYQGLARAEQRASRYFQGSAFKGGARYPWETVETGEEAAPPGFWYEHIFHMAHIALEAWYDYLFTADSEFLRQKGYPVIKGCADFFFNFAVYEIDGRTVIGKVTDLERLGTAVQNAYMTTCGAIAALQAAGAAADLLGLDPAQARQWRDAAQRLKDSLPQDGEKYIPFPGCDQKSVAVLSGLYPYAAVEADNALQRRAIDDFCTAGAAFGNMYPVGQSVCAWYAAWKTVIFARLGDGGKALAAARQVADGAGCFAELFEINEPAVSMKPWFSTAEGTYVQGLNEMLVQSSGDTIRVAPAIPVEWSDFAFRLNCQRGRIIAVQVAQGQIVRLRLQNGALAGASRLTLIIPATIVPACLPEAEFVIAANLAGSSWQLEIDPGSLSLDAESGELTIV